MWSATFTDVCRHVAKVRLLRAFMVLTDGDIFLVTVGHVFTVLVDLYFTLCVALSMVLRLCLVSG